MSEFNYKITYTYSQCFPKIDRKVIKIKKETVNLAFESEPSEYELLSKVKTWVNELQQNVMNDLDCKIEFQEIIKSKRLKVVKGIDDTDLSQF